MAMGGVTSGTTIRRQGSTTGGPGGSEDHGGGGDPVDGVTYSSELLEEGNPRPGISATGVYDPRDPGGVPDFTVQPYVSGGTQVSPGGGPVSGAIKQDLTKPGTVTMQGKGGEGVIVKGGVTMDAQGNVVDTSGSVGVGVHGGTPIGTADAAVGGKGGVDDKGPYVGPVAQAGIGPVWGEAGVKVRPGQGVSDDRGVPSATSPIVAPGASEPAGGAPARPVPTSTPGPAGPKPEPGPGPGGNSRGKPGGW